MAALFGTGGTGGVSATPARQDVLPSSDVDVSSLGQFMGTLALSQKRLGELAAASGGRNPDADLEQLGTAAGELVEAFNVGRAIDTLAPPSGEPLPANALAGRLMQGFGEQRDALAQIGIDLAPSLLGDDGDMLAVDNGRLQAAFEADRQGTLDTLSRAAGTFDQAASALAQQQDATGPDGNTLQAGNMQQAPATTSLPPSEINEAAFRNALRDTTVQPNLQNAPADDAGNAGDSAAGIARQPEAPQIAGSGTPAAMLDNQAAELTAAQAANPQTFTAAQAAAAQQAVQQSVPPPPTRVSGAAGEAQANPVQTPPAATTSPDQARADALARQLAAERFAAERAAVAENAEIRRQQAALQQQLAADREVEAQREAQRQVQRDEAARVDQDRAVLTQQERAAAGRLALARQVANETLDEQQDAVTQDQRLQEVRAAALRQLTTTREEDMAAQQLADRLDETRQETLTRTDQLAQDRLLAARREAARQTLDTQADALLEQRLTQARMAATGQAAARQAEDARQAAALTEAENTRQRDALRVLQDQGAERAQALLDQQRLALRTQQAAAAAGRGTAAGATALTGAANEQAVAGAVADAQIAASTATSV
ncbi:MAG TPA: hypothetical protein VF774_06095, partial [Pseudoduganella sp.]